MANPSIGMSADSCLHTVPCQHSILTGVAAVHANVPDLGGPGSCACLPIICVIFGTRGDFIIPLAAPVATDVQRNVHPLCVHLFAL